MCQVFGGLPCESRRTFAFALTRQAKSRAGRWHFQPLPEVVSSEAGPAPHRNRNFVTSFLDPLIAFVSAHAWLAYLTLFLAALLEAVPAAGSAGAGATGIPAP